MQTKPKPTVRKSNHVKTQTASKRKAKTGKQKTEKSIVINLEEKWLDKQEVLQRLHISSGTLQNWRKKGLLPYTAVIGKYYYKESDLQKLLHSFNTAHRA